MGISPIPHSPGHVRPNLTAYLDSRTPSPEGRYTSCQALGEAGCHFWSSAQGTANKDAVIRGGEVPAPLPRSMSRQEKLFLSCFAADRPGFLLSWLELILEARGPGTARSSSKYTQAAAPPAPTTKQGWALLRKVGHLGSWPPLGPSLFLRISTQRSGIGDGNFLEEVGDPGNGRNWEK